MTMQVSHKMNRLIILGTMLVLWLVLCLGQLNIAVAATSDAANSTDSGPNGTALMIKGVVTATSAAQVNRTLIKGGSVFTGDVISTAPQSFAVIRMLDNTKLTLRPDTTIAIGDFSLEEGKEEACVNLIKGGLRTVTGLIGERRPEAFSVDTPIASIGIRGTDFVTRICEGELCQLDQKKYIEERFGAIDDPAFVEELNEELPEGVYSHCVTGAIVMSQCAGQAEDFQVGQCRQTQQADCYEVNLNAGEAGYVGQTYFDAPTDTGVLPSVPTIIENDPYLKLSDLDDGELGLVEFFSEGETISQQCSF